MAFTFRIQLFEAFVLFALLSQVIGHSYVTSPISRSFQAQSESGCRGPACLGPCDIPLSQATRAPIVAARGSSITVNWPRNNHAGGFIRFAWAPTSQSDTASVFDQNVQQINCHEVGCGPSDPSNPNGGDNGPADGSSMACTQTFEIPQTLTDGDWTLQWAWFGGAFSLGDYYSCVDYKISGGPTGSFSPAFIGGDYTYPGQQKCKFFNTDALHQCVDEPCNNPIFPISQEESGAPASGQIGMGLASSSSSSSSSSSTSPAPIVSTGLVSPVTTGHVATPTPVVHAMTTGRVISTPTPSPAMTTGSVATPTPVISTPTPPVVSSGSSCAKVSSLSSSIGILSIENSWPGTIQAIVNLDVSETVLSNWVVEVIWPTSGAVSVTGADNAGSLLCQTVSASGSISYFKPSASWANNLVAGSVAPIEFTASTSLDADTILKGAQVRVFQQ